MPAQNPALHKRTLWQSTSGFHDYRLKALVVESSVSTEYYVQPEYGGLQPAHDVLAYLQNHMTQDPT